MMNRIDGMGSGRIAAARVVPVVACRGSRASATALATLLGFPAGLLLYLAAALAFAEPALSAPDADLVLATFLGGWALGGWLMARRTVRLLVVVRRGLLLGAVQWLLLVPLLSRLSMHSLPRASELLAQSLGGVPVSLPHQAEALLFAALCLLGAMAVTALPSALGVQLAEPARGDATG
jgi:hypothetical protein